MIDEEKTFELFGYYSCDLSVHSDKKIVCICNDCGKERILIKDNYRDLCTSCALRGKRNPMFGKHLSVEVRQKMSKVLKGKRCGENHPMFGKHHSIESSEKMSESHKGKCGEDSSHYIDGKGDERIESKLRGLPEPKIYLGDRYCKGVAAHHMTKKVIIYIPNYIHKKNYHRLSGEGMLKINILSLIFLLRGF